MVSVTGCVWVKVSIKNKMSCEGFIKNNRGIGAQGVYTMITSLSMTLLHLCGAMIS